jgi:hypothetical protein
MSILVSKRAASNAACAATEWILMIETDYVWKKAVAMPPPGSPAVVGLRTLIQVDP